MTKQGQKPIEVGLVLQGGGALGAYEWGAVTALLELMDEAETAGREVALKGVTGVSIGAINAACIVGSHGRADARRRLKELWEDLRLDAPSFLPAQVQRDLAFFGLPGFYAPRMDVWALPGWKYLYDTSPLIETLRRHVDFKALNASPTTFVVTAVDVVSGVLTRFRNHPHPREGKDRPPPKREADHVCAIEPRHILASGSLAPQFPWVEIGGASYWDGGLVDNTPLGDAIDAFSDDPDADRRLVVMNLYPLRARLPQNLAEVQDRVHELSFGNRLRQDHDGANRVNDLIGTICELAALAPEGAITGDLKRRVERANRFKRHRGARSRHAGPRAFAPARPPGGRAGSGRRPGRPARLLARHRRAPPRPRLRVREAPARAVVRGQGASTFEIAGGNAAEKDGVG